MGNPQITNLAKAPSSGIVVEVKVSRGRNHVLRAVSSKRAVYAGMESTELVNRTLDMAHLTSTTRDIPESVSAIVMAVSGDPVAVLAYPTADRNQVSAIRFTVSKLLILDTPLLGGLTLISSGTSQVDLNYQSEGSVT